ncbi:MAG: TIGR03118 family protein, partial [Abitibacteriaceae bacterium]|nr:TIGR03118 family protein [Abditibacteriaceae bacterium]
MNSKMLQDKTLRTRPSHYKHSRYQPTFRRHHRCGKHRPHGALGIAAIGTLIAVSGCGGGSNLNPEVPGVSSHGTANLLYPTPGPGPTANLPAFKVTTLVSDTAVAGAQRDPHLINGWGIAFSSFSTIWVSANGTGTTTVYDGTGKTVLPAIKIPAPPGQTGPSAPTGQIFNPSTSFKNDKFILSTEDGTIAGWQGGTVATMRVNESSSGAVYKGLAAANDVGRNLLYATDFHGGKIDVFDSNYNPVTLGGFKDASLPLGFAPFNITNFGKNLIVTYAKQDADKHDDVKGAGNGFVDVFSTGGHLLQRLVAHGALNSPWGVALAPDTFGALSHRLLIGNFGDGWVNVFNASNGASLGSLKDKTG